MSRGLLVLVLVVMGTVVGMATIQTLLSPLWIAVIQFANQLGAL